jgi:hypothetical protein
MVAAKRILPVSLAVRLQGCEHDVRPGEQLSGGGSAVGVRLGSSRVGCGGQTILTAACGSWPLERATRSTPYRGPSHIEVLRATSHAFSCSSVSASCTQV